MFFPIFTFVDKNIIVEYLSSVGLYQIQDQIKECRFTGSVIDDQTKPFSFFDVQLIDV